MTGTQFQLRRNSFACYKADIVATGLWPVASAAHHGVVK
jgi:hypothetical protein